MNMLIEMGIVTIGLCVIIGIVMAFVVFCGLVLSRLDSDCNKRNGHKQPKMEDKRMDTEYTLPNNEQVIDDILAGRGIQTHSIPITLPDAGESVVVTNMDRTPLPLCPDCGKLMWVERDDRKGKTYLTCISCNKMTTGENLGDALMIAREIKTFTGKTDGPP